VSGDTATVIGSGTQAIEPHKLDLEVYLQAAYLTQKNGHRYFRVLNQTDSSFHYQEILPGASYTTGTINVDKDGTGSFQGTTYHSPSLIVPRQMPGLMLMIVMEDERATGFNISFDAADMLGSHPEFKPHE